MKTLEAEKTRLRNEVERLEKQTAALEEQLAESRAETEGEGEE